MKRRSDTIVASEPSTRVRNRNSKVSKVRDVIGTGLKYIGPYKRLDNTKQVVALINDVRTPYYIMRITAH